MTSGTPVLIRNSEQSLFKECRLAWDWAYNYRIRTDRPQKNLLFGTWCHKAWELWYPPGFKRGIKPWLTFESEYEAYLNDGGERLFWKEDNERGPGIDMMDLGIDMMHSYVERWGKDEHIEVVSAEQTFSVDVFSKTGTYLFTVVGTIDGVIRFYNDYGSKLLLLEHKTGATLDPFGAPLPLDEQGGTYWAFGPEYLRDQGIIGEKDVVEGVLFNRARKTMRDIRPKNKEGLSLNKDGTVSKRQPNEAFKREVVLRDSGSLRKLRQRWAATAREMRLARQGQLAIYKTPGRHCGYCEFRSMCEVEETGSDWESMVQFFAPWDPYDAHEIWLEGKL